VRQEPREKVLLGVGNELPVYFDKVSAALVLDAAGPEKSFHSLLPVIGKAEDPLIGSDDFVEIERTGRDRCIGKAVKLHSLFEERKVKTVSVVVKKSLISGSEQ
jgi:hypothetical protein